MVTTIKVSIRFLRPLGTLLLLHFLLVVSSAPPNTPLVVRHQHRGHSVYPPADDSSMVTAGPPGDDELPRPSPSKRELSSAEGPLESHSIQSSQFPKEQRVDPHSMTATEDHTSKRKRISDAGIDSSVSSLSESEGLKGVMSEDSPGEEDPLGLLRLAEGGEGATGTPHRPLTPPPCVTTDSGDIAGLWMNVSTGSRVAAFLGIPYAEPPVGDLRFRAPVPVAPWRGTKEATKFGPMCIQPGNQYVWDAVRFPPPTPSPSQHQKVGEEHLFSAAIADKPPDERSPESQGPSDVITMALRNRSSENGEGGMRGPVMRRRRMRNYEMSEDCLTLNVYTPRIPNSNGSEEGLPILFFIHGGSYYMNGGRLYPGEELAARGAVVVTFNYRLGPFGFLSTGEPSCHGNWGLWDQVEALRWVRQNAKSFGGDAHNALCLVGNSAGAASVLLHMVSPVSRGLFSCAVAMSGCSGAPWALQTRPMRHAKSLAASLGCPSPSRRPHHAVACLRTFSAHLIAENADLEDGLGVAFAPVVDGLSYGRRGGSDDSSPPGGGGPFIPDDPRRLMTEGKFAQVPFLSGLTRDEVSIWFSNFGPTMERRLMRVFLDKDIRQLLNSTGMPALNSIALSHAAAHLYLWGGRGTQEDRGGADGARGAESAARGSDPGARGSTLAVADFISDVGLKAPCVYDMELIARFNRKPSFFYEFQYHSVDDARTDKQEWIGAYHESELQFLFGEPFLGFSNHLRAANDKEVSEMLMALWINFAKHGHPTPGGDKGIPQCPVEWLPFTNNHRQYLVLGYRPRMAENYLTERMVFWNHIADAFRRHPMPPYCTQPPTVAPSPDSPLFLPVHHWRWVFWVMAAGNLASILGIVVCIIKLTKKRMQTHNDDRSATPGI